MALKSILLTLLLCISISANASPKEGVGVNLGVGLPFIGQIGLSYYFAKDFSLTISDNKLDLSIDTASVELGMPEVLLSYHPFSGSFFIGAGIGKETLKIHATDSLGQNEVRLNVKANTFIAKTGWMWGAANGGFWFGMDAAYIMPSGAKTKLSNNGANVTDEHYLDAIEAGNKFGETNYLSITFARFGWIF